MQKLLIAAIIVVVAGGTAWWMARQPPDGGGPVAPVIMPELSGDAVLGQQVFAASCAVCHGNNAQGVPGTGPTLINKVYRPANHSDITFLLAVRNGVRQHHWKFGPMLPMQDISETDIALIVEYVRAIQRANGVE